MALYKDGEVIRTYEEQVDHLTEAHRKQLKINEDVTKNLNELSVASNLGGYNLVRFAFEKQGTFYKIANESITVNSTGGVGDYVEITTNNLNDIPAYGYFTGEHTIKISWFGDFIEQYSKFTIHNVTKKTSNEETIETVAFTGTSLSDYDPNDCKKQLFRVISDMAFNARTEYVSFDLNRDGIYSFVFIGGVNNGADGKSIYTVNNSNVATILQGITLNDSVLFGEDNQTSYVDSTAKIGDLYRFKGNNIWEKIGNIRGAQGLKGDKGDTGEQGVQGIQGIQGIQGEQGQKGDKGDPGDQGLLIHDAILNSPSELPNFATAKIGDAYRIIDTSGSVVVYNLYFKSVDGSTWSIQPNWGGVKVDKGDKVDTGLQGQQGIQGIQGPKGEKGDPGEPGVTNFKTLFGNKSIVGSGNIDLYVHNISMLTLYVDQTKVQVDISFECYSSSNVEVKSLTDLFTLFSGRVIVAGGLCLPANGNKDFNVQLISITNAANSYIQYYNDGSYSRAFLRDLDTSINISDNIKTL